MKTLSIAKDFSRFPGGRYRRLGRFSGEQFRDDCLQVHLHSGEIVSVDLDGTSGLGSSFLDEAFGGLVRIGFKESFLKSHLILTAQEPDSIPYVDEAWQYIREESGRAKVTV
ncbi:MAG TPA: STAS-like domain-containing protein [Woeseiaceae bacterium]|nr:STAS-like domain-containing protein [Woeseiaceae bacterium]